MVFFIGIFSIFIFIVAVLSYFFAYWILSLFDFSSFSSPKSVHSRFIAYLFSTCFTFFFVVPVVFFSLVDQVNRQFLDAINQFTRHSEQQISQQIRQPVQSSPVLPPSIRVSAEHEKVWVVGKSRDECVKIHLEKSETNIGDFNNCVTGYYKLVKISH